jgi:bifunctional DNA-binding transcriptional regulator/antitoxin component of YhaV-PrlF toxin-antitoxin module
MKQVTVSSKGQVATPRPTRTAHNLTEGTKPSLRVRGQKIVLSKDRSWKTLASAAADRDLMIAFAADKKQEREREDSRS